MRCLSKFLSCMSAFPGALTLARLPKNLAVLLLTLMLAKTPAAALSRNTQPAGHLRQCLLEVCQDHGGGSV